MKQAENVKSVGLSWRKVHNATETSECHMATGKEFATYLGVRHVRDVRIMLVRGGGKDVWTRR